MAAAQKLRIMQQLKHLNPNYAIVLVQPHVVAGDQVTWTESDADIPAGTVGTVQVALPTTEKGRVPVKFRRDTWDLKRSQLKLFRRKAEVERLNAEAKRKAKAEAEAKAPGSSRQLKSCGHFCFPGKLKKCCVCEDTRPLIRDGTYTIYVDGRGYVDEGNRDDGSHTHLMLFYSLVLLLLAVS